MPLLNKIVQLPYGWGFRWGVCTVCAWSRVPIRPPSCSFDSVLAKVSSRLCTNCCAVSGGGLAAGPHRPPQPGGNVYTPLGTQLIYHIYTCRSAAYDTRLSQVLLIRFLKRPCYKVRTSRPCALPVPAAVERLLVFSAAAVMVMKVLLSRRLLMLAMAVQRHVLAPVLSFSLIS